MSVYDLDFKKLLKKREFANGDFYDATYTNYDKIPTETTTSSDLQSFVKNNLSQIIPLTATQRVSVDNETQVVTIFSEEVIQTQFKRVRACKSFT